MTLKTVELFAGVGGFRLGLDLAGGFETVWFNQWEPKVSAQHAYNCYVKNFEPDTSISPEGNADIATVSPSAIPDHDLLVGGFPCQDYSVAATLDKAHGLRGKKGVLWWEIRRILQAKRPEYVLLENVDRLLRSPVKQRGRDFAILLACLRNLGYVVEWRVVKASDYGFPQKRRRVFIFAAQKSGPVGEWLSSLAPKPEVLTKSGYFASEFPVRQTPVMTTDSQRPSVILPKSISKISNQFDFHFQNAGVMVGNKVWTQRVEPNGEEPITILESVLRPCTDDRYFIPKSKIDGPKGWRYMRSSKKETRTAKNGHVYHYAEGAMAFPDPSNQPARTLLTGEGGTNASRSNHAVRDPSNGRIRTLTPEECERINGFPIGHTEMLPERWRYFTMGNALVVGLVERMGTRLASLHESLNEEKQEPETERMQFRMSR